MDFKEIAQIIVPFPSIAARIIGLANSAWSSPISPITDIDAACSRLGLNVVRSTCIALAVASPFNSTLCPSFSTQDFWCRALLVSDISSGLAESSNQEVAANTVRTAGLLHNLGLLLLADQLPQETHQILQQHQKETDTSFGQLMIKKLGYDYAEAGAFILKLWGLPEIIIDSIQYQRENPNTQKNVYAATINYASTIVQATEQQTPEAYPQSITSLGINSGDMGRLILRTEKQRKKTKELAQALFNN